MRFIAKFFKKRILNGKMGKRHNILQHMKRYLTSLIEKCKLKLYKDHFSHKLLRIKKYASTFCWQSCGKQALLHFDGGDANRSKLLLEGFLAISKNTICTLSIRASNFTSRNLYFPKIRKYYVQSNYLQY